MFKVLKEKFVCTHVQCYPLFGGLAIETMTPNLSGKRSNKKGTGGRINAHFYIPALDLFSKPMQGLSTTQGNMISRLDLYFLLRAIAKGV